MTKTQQIHRRGFLAGAAAIAGTPLIAQSDPWQPVAQKAAGLGQSHAILIRQNGETQLSAQFRGPALGRAVPIKSVSKTVVAALLGAALDRGEIPDVDATLGQLAPQLIPADADPRVADISMSDLVTMRARLERTSGANYGGWVSSRNWVANALSRPIVAPIGTRMLYSTGSFHILGAVLSEVSGQSLLALARTRLGDPLGIEVPAWTRDPQGRYLGGNEMALTLDGMVRFGEMYRQDGSYAGQQILSADWVAQSFDIRTRSPFSGLSYGYGWFLGQGGGIRYALARGYGGQIICVAPDIALTLAITSDPTQPARSGGYFGDLKSLIEDDILPLAQQSAG